MNSDVFSDVLQQLEQRPDRLSDIRLWLFVAVNTARALIDSTDKQALENAVFTEANDEFYYGIVNRRDGSVILNRKELVKKLGLEDPDAEIKVWAVSDRGVCYEAVLPEQG